MIWISNHCTWLCRYSFKSGEKSLDLHLSCSIRREIGKSSGVGSAAGRAAQSSQVPFVFPICGHKVVNKMCTFGQSSFFIMYMLVLYWKATLFTRKQQGRRCMFMSLWRCSTRLRQHGSDNTAQTTHGRESADSLVIKSCLQESIGIRALSVDDDMDMFDES